MVELVHDPIDPARVLRSVTSAQAGAIVLFLGTTREMTHGRRTLWLLYEGHPEMALAQLRALESEARRRWPLVECRIVHRLGRVDLSESSVAVAVSSPHRRAAFEAGQWLIDTLKEVVPIWKQEHWADGTTEWVHPGVASPESASRELDSTELDSLGHAPETDPLPATSEKNS